jgi:hypothetical protein
MLDVLAHEGVVAIVTQGENEPHVVNTWNSYVQPIDGDKLIIPAGRMVKTERNIEKNANVQLTLGSRDVQGLQNMGTGFLVKGQAQFEKSGSHLDLIRAKFPWARAALVITIESAEQTL